MEETPVTNEKCMSFHGPFLNFPRLPKHLKNPVQCKIITTITITIESRNV